MPRSVRDSENHGLIQCRSKVSFTMCTSYYRGKNVEFTDFFNKDEALVGRILDGTPIDFYCLSQQDKKVIYLLFRSMEFEAYLNEPNVQGLLSHFGYQDISLVNVL